MSSLEAALEPRRSVLTRTRKRSSIDLSSLKVPTPPSNAKHRAPPFLASLRSSLKRSSGSNGRTLSLTPSRSLIEAQMGSRDLLHVVGTPQHSADCGDSVANQGLVGTPRGVVSGSSKNSFGLRNIVGGNSSRNLIGGSSSKRILDGGSNQNLLDDSVDGLNCMSRSRLLEHGGRSSGNHCRLPGENVTRTRRSRAKRNAQQRPTLRKGASTMSIFLPPAAIDALEEDPEQGALEELIQLNRDKLEHIRSPAHTHYARATQRAKDSNTLRPERIRAEAQLVLAERVKQFSRKLRTELMPLVEKEVARINSCTTTSDRVKHRLIKMRRQVARRRIALEVERKRVDEWSEAELRKRAVQQIHRLDATMLLNVEGLSGGLDDGLGLAERRRGSIGYNL